MTNRLSLEKSPYLLQHANNPVDWYPWGEEAFLAAKERNCPIFLSIGYASCHWCHVMEKEAFTDLETAGLLNESFINIKVDKEERPEVNGLYMECAELLMAGSSGWPLNVLLTPDLKPFFSVTYLPLEPQKGLMGIKQFISQIKQVWESPDRVHLIEQAEKVAMYLKENAPPVGNELPSQKDVLLCAETILHLADPIFGGIQGEPKFPFSYQCSLLLDLTRLFKEGRFLSFLETTLHKMYEGGLFDHLGGGFSRYSVDRRWHIPHFEKMLIDNVLLAGAYLEAWKFTKEPLYETVCKETLEYVLRELKGSNGGFISAEDADSEGDEGSYYLWSFEEVQKALTPAQFLVFSQAYVLSPEGSFRNKNVLRLVEPLEDAQEHSGLDQELFMSSLKTSRKELLRLRGVRMPPLKDDQVISSQNGAAIHVLLQAGAAFGEKRYKEAAQECALFLKKNFWEKGRLLRLFPERKGLLEGCLDDYAYCIKASLTLFEEGEGIEWLIWAMDLSDVLKKEFKKTDGAFYFSKADPFLFLRLHDFYDGAAPSGNSVHAENLVKLYQITGEKRFLSEAEDVFRMMKSLMKESPISTFYGFSALLRLLDLQSMTVVIALNKEQSGREEIAKTLGAVYRPHSVTIWVEEGNEALFLKVPYLREKKVLNDKTTLYVCYADRCRPPVNDLSEILAMVQNF